MTSASSVLAILAHPDNEMFIGGGRTSIRVRRHGGNASCPDPRDRRGDVVRGMTR